MSIDKENTCNGEALVKLIRRFIPDMIIEVQSETEIIFGIMHGVLKNIRKLLLFLNRWKRNLRIHRFGISMITIEDVFLKYAMSVQRHI